MEDPIEIPLDEEEYSRVIYEFMETVGPHGLTESSLIEGVTPLLNELATLKMHHSLYELYKKGLVTMVIQEGQVAFKTTDEGLKAIEDYVPVDNELLQEIESVVEDTEESGNDSTVRVLTPRYWIDKWLSSNPSGSADDLIFYLAEHGLVVDTM